MLKSLTEKGVVQSVICIISLGSTFSDSTTIHPQLAESVDVELMATEGQLYPDPPARGQGPEMFVAFKLY